MYSDLNPAKVYVGTSVLFDKSGHMLPDCVTWRDGRKFSIDRITDVRQAAAMRAGGLGSRYTVWINGQQSFLFFERTMPQKEEILGRWFVEAK